MDAQVAGHLVFLEESRTDSVPGGPALCSGNPGSADPSASAPDRQVPGAWAFRLRLNHTICFPGAPARSRQIMGLLSPHSHMSQSL